MLTEQNVCQTEESASTPQETATRNVGAQDGAADPSVAAGAPAPPLPRVTLGPNGEVFAEREGKPAPVRVCCCFPWTESRRYVSLRDYDGNEVALVRDLGDLDRDSRLAVEQALAETGFVLEVEAIESLVTEFEIRNWKVRTRQGACTFQTELDDWPRALPGGGLLFRDVAGDLFHIPRPKELDEKSLKLLWAFVD